MYSDARGSVKIRSTDAAVEPGTMRVYGVDLVLGHTPLPAEPVEFFRRDGLAKD